MSSFTKPLTVTQLQCGKLWKAERAFYYCIGLENSQITVHIPQGYISDGASIPRFLWSIVGHPMGQYAQAAFIHDKLYTTKKYSRKQADLIFLESMEVLGVPKWKRNIMYSALRMFGWCAWRKKAK